MNETIKLPDMERYQDWAPRLNKYLTDVQSDRFQMGVHDCCTFAAGAIEAMTGVDHMSEFREQYDSWESSDEALIAIGQGDLYATLTKKFGQMKPAARGLKGDIAWSEGSLGLVLGVYAIFLGANGLAYVKLTKLDGVFKVPE